jgi:hypothetical protein
MQDLTSECLSDLGPELTSLGVQGLRQAMCVRCFNPQCGYSRTSGTLWEQRMATQVDRLLVNPHFADPSSSRYEPVLSAQWENVKPSGWISLNDSGIVVPSPVAQSPKPLRNTAVPQGGIMIGGAQPPAPSVADPWALPPKTVKAGATVKMGGK